MKKVFSARRDANSRQLCYNCGKRCLCEGLDLRGRMTPQRVMDAPYKWRVVGGPAQPTTGRGIPPHQGREKGNSLGSIIVRK
jgi:hypothetical protein